MNPHGLSNATRTERLRNGYCPDCVPLIEAKREQFERIQQLGQTPPSNIRYICGQCGVSWGPGSGFQFPARFEERTEG